MARGVTLGLGLLMRALPATAATGGDAEATERHRWRSRPARVLAAGETRGRPRRSEGPGHVQFITALRAYVDRGKADGLVEGQYLEMLRGGHFVGRCTIEHLGDHAAVCQGAALRVGDTFRKARSPRPSPVRARPALPIPSEPAALDARARALAETAFPKVEFAPRDRDGVAPSVWADAGVAAWSGGAGLGSGTSGYVEEHVDGRIQRLRLGQSDLRFDLAFTALRWQSRPAAARFLPDARTELFVWQAEVSRREVDDRTVLGVGRLWPRHVPGVPMIDGLQLGRRSEAGTAEGGFYAGTAPTDAGLVPTLTNWAAGLYGVLVAASPRSGALPSAAVESRIGARRASAGGALSEGELLGQLWARSWGLGGGGRATSMTNEARPRLEFAHLHLRARDRARVGGWLELRYLGPTSRDELGPTGEQASRTGGYHGVFGAHADISEGVGLGLLASAHRDRASGVRSFDGMLELRLPRLFSNAGGLWLAANAAEGWVRSRGVSLQYLGVPVGAARILARVEARTSRFEVPDALVDATEVDAYVHLDAPVTARVRLRGRSSFFVPIAVQGQSPTTPRLLYQLGLDAVALF